VGLPYESDVVHAGPDYDGHARAYGFFGQDAWKVTSKLTLNFGLRYEYHPPFHDNTLQMANFNRVNGAVVVPNAASLKLASQVFLESIDACGLATPNPPPDNPNAPCTPVQTAAAAGIPQSLRRSDKSKVLPRLSFAYRLDDKTVVRAGAGMYDETLLGQIFYSLIGIHTSDYGFFFNSISGGVPAFQFPQTQGGSAAAPTAGSAAFGTANQSDLHDPYAEQWSFTERDLGWQTGLRVTYTGLRSIGLIVSPDLNQVHANSVGYFNTIPGSSITTADTRPYLNWSVVKGRDNGGSAIYNGLETVVTHRFSQGVNFQSSYIYSKNLSDSEGDASNAGFPGEAGPRLVDRFNLQADCGNVTYTRRHRWLTTASWELPVGRGQRFGSSMNPVLNGIIGGWQTTNIFLAQSGPFLTPTYSGGNDPSGTNGPDRIGSQRPDRLPLSACDGLSTRAARPLAGSCFYYGWADAIGRFGNSGVGIINGPGTVDWNFGLAKSFALKERAKLRFESTFTNFLNHPNLVYSTTHLRANSSTFGVLNEAQSAEGLGARVIQFALRLDF